MRWGERAGRVGTRDDSGGMAWAAAWHSGNLERGRRGEGGAREGGEREGGRDAAGQARRGGRRETASAAGASQ